MFHVELMRNLIGGLLVIIFLAGCEKPNPNPEQMDPIYQDLEKKAEELKKTVEEAKAAVADARSEVKAATPQSRQIEYANKRLDSAIQKYNRAVQISAYFQVRAENRLAKDRKDYADAYSKKQPWPDPQEYEQYKVAEKLIKPPAPWSAADRRTEAGFANKAEKKPEAEKPGASEAPKAE